MKKEDIAKAFMYIPTLQTERLYLRRLRVTDASDMFAYAKDPVVTRYLTWCPHANLRYTYRYLEYVATQYSAGTFFDWALECRETGRMIGTCGFTRFHYQDNAAEIGYVLNPSFWGRGLASEAAKRVLTYGFETLGLHRIEARYMLGNDASRRVMEKCGMSFEGVLRDVLYLDGEYRSVGICSIVRSPGERGTFT